MKFLRLKMGETKPSNTEHHLKVNGEANYSRICIMSKTHDPLDLPYISRPSIRTFAYKDPELTNLLGPTVRESVVYREKSIDFQTRPSGLVYYEEYIQHTPITLAVFDVIKNLINEGTNIPFDMWYNLIEIIDREWD